MTRGNPRGLGPVPTRWACDLQAVRQMRGFLQAPERYLREIVAGSDGA